MKLLLDREFNILSGKRLKKTANVTMLIMPDYSKCDYSKAVIYKIICKDPEIKETYVGSTCHFKARIRTHKSGSKIKNLKVYTFINENGGWNNWKCDIIQDYPCSGLEELKILEDHYIKEMGTLNGKGAVFDEKEYHKEYNQLNKDKRKEHTKKYRELNKNKIKEKDKKYYAKKIAEAANFYYNMRSILNNKNLSKEYKMENISDVQTLKTPELREMARRYGLKRISKLTKKELVDVLVNHLESIVAEPVEPIKAEDVVELPTQEIEAAVAELSVESDETPPESPPKKTRKPRKRKTVSDSD
jgi:hypothetical protein